MPGCLWPRPRSPGGSERVALAPRAGWRRPLWSHSPGRGPDRPLRAATGVWPRKNSVLHEVGSQNMSPWNRPLEHLGDNFQFQALKKQHVQAWIPFLPERRSNSHMKATLPGPGGRRNSSQPREGTRGTCEQNCPPLVSPRTSPHSSLTLEA